MVNVHRCRFVDYTPNTITNLAFSHESTTKFSPNDLRLAVGRGNGDIEIWNPKNKWMQETTLFGGKDRTIEGLVWSTKEGESPRLFSIGGSTILTEWDLQTGLPLNNFDCNAAMIWSIAINESQDKIALGCDDGTVVVVDISGGKGVIEHHAFLQRQENRVLSLAFNKDDYVIGGCSDGRIRVWKVSNKSKGQENNFNIVSTMKVDKSTGETTLVWSVIYLPKRNQIVTGDSTGSIKFWDFEHFTLLQNFKLHDADILTLTTDMENETIFSAGVDRKIFKYQYIKPGKSSGKVSRWVNNSHKIYHANDIRTITCYESKNINFLLSGGVDKHIVLSSLQNFTEGEHRKLTFIPQRNPVIINDEKRYVILWQEQTIKIWKLNQRRLQGEEVSQDEEDSDDSDIELLTDSYKLVSKLTLADEDNITTVAISQDGTTLAVGRLTTTKLFKLTETKTSNKLQVKKIENLNLLNQGSTLLKFYGNDSLILTNPDNEIYKFDLENDDSDSDSSNNKNSITEFELPELPNSKSKLTFIDNINHLVVSHSLLIVSRISGAVDIIDLSSKDQEPFPFLRLSTYINKLEISPNFTLIILTSENKLFEFELKHYNTKSSHLTNWSKTNSEFLPNSFTNVKDLPLGFMFESQKSNRVWIYGASWLAMFDLSLNIQTKKIDKKRNRQGNQVSKNENNEDVEMEDVSDEEKNPKNKAFWISDKYKPILFAGSLTSESNEDEKEFVIIERPESALAQQPAFKISQFKI